YERRTDSPALDRVRHERVGEHEPPRLAPIFGNGERPVYGELEPAAAFIVGHVRFHGRSSAAPTCVAIDRLSARKIPRSGARDARLTCDHVMTHLTASVASQDAGTSSARSD